jgi:hypothetical protein
VGDRRGGGNPYLPTFAAPGIHQHVGTDGTTLTAADPNVPFALRRDLMLAQAREADKRATPVREQLRSVLASSNAVEMYMAIAARERISRSVAAPQMFGYDAMVDYLGGVVTSIPADVIERNEDKVVPAKDLFVVDSLLRSLAGLESQASLATINEQADGRHANARFMLVQEQQFDRMTGYMQHIGRVVTAVFGPLASAAEVALGISPVRVLEIAGLHARRQEDLLEKALAKSAHANPSDWEEASIEVLDRMTSALSCDVRDTMLDAGLTARDIDAFVRVMETPLGSQNVWELASPNRLRQFPLIRTANGGIRWPRPYDFMHDSLEWFDQVLLDEGHDKLREQLARRRAKVTENLVADSFSRVFGRDRVWSSVEYELKDGTWAETDVVVNLASSQLVVEAKAHRLTPRGRSGDPARVRKKFDELVTLPLAQSSRARDALLEGAPKRIKKSRKLLELPVPSVVHRVVVSLDRVDPFVMNAREHAGSTEVMDAWLVSLTDLLMVVDILGEGCELFAYVAARIAQTAAGSPIVITESDALGAWLKSREGAWPTTEGELKFLSYSGEAVNQFFTGDELHRRRPDRCGPAQAPDAGTPPAVAAAMRKLLDDPDERWEELALLVGAVQPRMWPLVIRDAGRVASRPRSRQQRKARDAALRGRRIHDRLEVNFGAEVELTEVPEGFVLTVVEPSQDGNPARGPEQGDFK